MSALPALPELRLVAVDAAASGMEGARMSYMEAGASLAGTPIVLLHGIGSNCTGWRFLYDALGRQARVIGWNAPGYYLSDNFAAAAPTHWQYADALAAFMDALGVDRAHVVGSSFGSMVGMSFAARHPDRVVCLALLGGSRGQKWLPAEERARRLAMRDAGAAEGAVAMSEKRWQVLLGPAPSETAVRLTRELLMGTHPRGYRQAARASDAVDVCEFAERIAAPTLFIVGDADQVNPPEVSRAIAQRIAGSAIEVLPGVGHLPKFEAPERTIALLRRHFAL
ncbi:MAG: alpha/beta fold hydrolase [Burkholderiales bacterium]|nr:alpha/beta fold hydrolase [Burkholderiales bacterium]